MQDQSSGSMSRSQETLQANPPRAVPERFASLGEALDYLYKSIFSLTDIVDRITGTSVPASDSVPEPPFANGIVGNISCVTKRVEEATVRIKELNGRLAELNLAITTRVFLTLEKNVGATRVIDGQSLCDRHSKEHFVKAQEKLLVDHHSSLSGR